ncbi:MAG TPA: siderophore biosynthesis protein [Bacteroidetes bacterium]|nr:siderophore biosynthesis protein [Bacteroidota bacterium]
MPKVWQKYVKSGSLSGLWRISESVSELKELYTLGEPEVFVREDRARQWLASRILLQDLVREFGYAGAFSLTKQPDGRPVLSVPGIHVSISHAGDYAAVAVGDSPIGIDVEKLGQRVQRIRQKFMNVGEIAQLQDEADTDWMHVVWSAKEALFKFHPEGNIDFREHLHLKKMQEGMLAAEIRKDGEQMKLQVPYEQFDSYIIAWAFE